jgi:pseudouridine synthase
VASRREADRLIAEGRVRVNGRIIQQLGSQIDPGQDLVKVDGCDIKQEGRLVYLMLNKPAGYLVTLKDPFRRPTIKDLLPPSGERIFTVGRLDFESEGLLLLTNDGELTFRLSHPGFEVRKSYLVKVKGEPTANGLEKLRRGIFVGGHRTAPARVTILAHNPKRSLLRIEIHEGRKHEVRLMCLAIGHDVVSLKRSAMAGLTLGKLKPGEWRYLGAAEVRKLKKLVNLV